MKTLNRAPQVDHEEARIAASNAAREIQRHKGYVAELRADVVAANETIKRLRKEADELEASNQKRAERLRAAEQKLAKTETER